jgi:hypothetical protein
MRIFRRSSSLSQYHPNSEAGKHQHFHYPCLTASVHFAADSQDRIAAGVPLPLAVLYVGVLRATGEAAMGPQIGGSIVAIRHGLEPPLITLMVGFGITLSFLTLPAW